MHNACVLSVEKHTGSRVVEQLLCTAGLSCIVSLWQSTRLFRDFLPTFYRLFPTNFQSKTLLLQAELYPLSTAPITRATISEKNNR